MIRRYIVKKQWGKSPKRRKNIDELIYKYKKLA